ncbi:MAG: hypothetical protein ACREU6_12485 [Steroidobacteraceae bacterium]
MISQGGISRNGLSTLLALSTLLTFWSRNLLNRDYSQNVTVQAGNSGLVVGAPSDPRLVGGTVRIMF